MAIAFVNSSSNTAAGAAVTVNKPTGVADGDILLACGYSYNDAVPSVTLPADWTELTTNTFGSTTRMGYWAWKRASGEGDNYTFTGNTGSTNICAAILAYSGCIASGTPYDQLSNTNYRTSDNSLVAADMTPTVSPSMAVILGVGRAYYTSGTVNNGFSERIDVSLGGFLYGAEKALTNTAAVGTTTITAAGTATPIKHAVMLNLKELAVPATFTGLVVTRIIGP